LKVDNMKWGCYAELSKGKFLRSSENSDFFRVSCRKSEFSVA
jgi:hypothetical protein